MCCGLVSMLVDVLYVLYVLCVRRRRVPYSAGSVSKHSNNIKTGHVSVEVCVCVYVMPLIIVLPKP